MQFAFLFPRFKLLSGAERLILKLAGALVQKGHSVTIFCHQFHESCRPILAPGIDLKVTKIKLDFFRNRYLNAAFDYFRSSALAQGISNSIDAACCFGPALTATPILITRQKFPVLYFCYEPPRFLYTDRSTIQRNLTIPRVLSNPLFNLYSNRDQKLARNVDGILCNSRFGAKRIQEIYERSATVITHGIDPFQPSTDRNPLRKRFGFTDSNFVVLTVNYLHPRKRIDLFLQTIALAQKTNPLIRGLIIGDGPEKERLMKHPNAASSIFAGFVPDEQLFHHYQAADLYLHTASMETFGLSVIEAAGNQLPVVSVNEGGPCETVLENQSGFLAESNANALAAFVIKLSNDTQMCEKFGKAGQRYVLSKYQWNQGAEDFLNALPHRH